MNTDQRPFLCGDNALCHHINTACQKVTPGARGVEATLSVPARARWTFHAQDPVVLIEAIPRVGYPGTLTHITRTAPSCIYTALEPDTPIFVGGACPLLPAWALTIRRMQGACLPKGMVVVWDLAITRRSLHTATNICKQVWIAAPGQDAFLLERPSEEVAHLNILEPMSKKCDGARQAETRHAPDSAETCHS